MLFETLDPEQQKSYQAKEAERKKNQFAWFKQKYAAMLDSKDILSEEEILLDHEYDGIRELDNNLPPWWKYLFYVTIIFAGRSEERRVGRGVGPGARGRGMRVT